MCLVAGLKARGALRVASAIAVGTALSCIMCAIVEAWILRTTLSPPRTDVI